MPIESEIITYDQQGKTTMHHRSTPLVLAGLPAQTIQALQQASFVTLVNTFLAVTVDELGASVDAAIDLMRSADKPVDIVSVLPPGERFPAANISKMREFGERLFSYPHTGHVFVVVPEGAQMLAFFAFTIGKLIGYEMHRAASLEQAQAKIRTLRGLPD